MEGPYDVDCGCGVDPRSSFKLLHLSRGYLISLETKKQTIRIPIHYDNKPSIHIVENSVYHERTKHIDMDCHFIINHFQDGLIQLILVPSFNKLVDIFTKASELLFSIHSCSSCSWNIFLSNLKRAWRVDDW